MSLPSNVVFFRCGSVLHRWARARPAFLHAVLILMPNMQREGQTTQKFTSYTDTAHTSLSYVVEYFLLLALYFVCLFFDFSVYTVLHDKPNLGMK